MNDQTHNEEQNTLIETIALDDRLNLEIYDASKFTAGDHWQVVLLTRLEIPVEILYQQDSGNLPAADEIRGALGDPLVYEHRYVLNFINKSNKQAVLDSLFQNFKNQIFPYVSKPGFPVSYAAKRYREYMKRKPYTG